MLHHQSLKMTQGIKFAVVIFACFTVTNGILTQFPHGKTLVYNYYGDVKAGIIEPAPYASQFSITGKLYIKHDTSDPNLPYAYYVALRDVKTGMHNGAAAHFQQTTSISPIPDAAKVIQDPFLIINNKNGELQAMKISESEAGWSQNMKMAIGTMLQLDLMNINLQLPVKHHNFMSKEKTIQGECWTSYDVHAKYPNTVEQDKNFIVTKFTSPENCSDYNVHVFDQMDAEQCNLPREAPVNMASRRVFDIEHQGDNILIKSLIAHGGTNYFPLKGRSEAHYILNNASFILENIVTTSDIELPQIDFQKIPTINNLSYKRAENNYATDSDIDITQGRHVVHQDILISVIKKMLGEAADYLSEYHLDLKEPDFMHGQTINRILNNMGYLDKSSMMKIFTDINVPTPTDRDNTIKNIYLGVISHVGTTASITFIRDLILLHRVNVTDARRMLVKFPLHIRNPNVNLLVEMEDLIKVDNNEIEKSLRKLSILSFATMVFKTFKNSHNLETNITLQIYIDRFYDRLLKEPEYEMKITYLNALRNVEVGKIEERLVPIIRGDIKVSENPVHLRLMAIWAINKAISGNYNFAHDLLWPIMADYNVPLKLRIAAYDILIRHTPTMTNILHIYWFMVYEKNEHLYNYHHTTIKGLANSVDPCNYQLTELTTKIMRYTKIHAPVSHKLSSSYMIDSMDNFYGHGEKFLLSTTKSEVTGFPEVVHFEFISIGGRKPVSEVSIDLHIEGYEDIMSTCIGIKSTTLNDENVLNVLKKAAHDMPPKKKIHVDLILMRRGRVVFVNHYNQLSLKKLYDDIKNLISLIGNEGKLMGQNIIFSNIYEQHVISEMGLPVVMGTKIPHVPSLKAHVEFDQIQGTASLDFDVRLWRHGDYYMSIYNPLMDVWHSIRRSSALDISIPIRFIVNSQNNVLKLTIPLLPVEKAVSTIGMRMHTKDITTVSENEQNSLKSACPTCHHQEIVTKGVADKKYSKISFDSKDTGFQYISSIFDCENEIDPTYFRKQWIRSVDFNHKNSWNNELIDLILGVRQYIKNIILSPPMGSCGIIEKIEPSIVHPTSHIDITYRPSYELLDDDGKSRLTPNQKINIRATMEAIAASTNITARSWDLNVNIYISRDHLNNSLKMQLTRVTPGEKNLKICIEGQKTYPPIPTDPLKVGVNREETDAKLTISMVHTDENILESGSCKRDGSVINIVVKGELSNEQKKLFIHDSAVGSCKNDIDNPLIKNSVNLVPRTINCIEETIRHTTLRKYTFNIIHKKVPSHVISQILDSTRSHLGSYVDFTHERAEPENIKVEFEFPIKTDLDLTVIAPTLDYDLSDYWDTSVDSSRLNGFGPDYNKHLWMYPLDNTRFPMKFLVSYINGDSKICTLFPKITLTLDGGEIPYVISDNWTLAIGNYIDEDFAVFVKNINDKIAMKVYVMSDIIEIIPIDSRFNVTINGEQNNVEGSGITTIDNSTRIMKYGDQIIAQLFKQLLMIVQTNNSLTMIVDSHLQGVIAGLCGHMTGDYKTEIPRDYRLN